MAPHWAGGEHWWEFLFAVVEGEVMELLPKGLASL